MALAFEAGRDGFWLARWLRARRVEAHVIHPSSVAVSRDLLGGLSRGWRAPFGESQIATLTSVGSRQGSDNLNSSDPKGDVA
jgi:hypothetical protein